MHMCAPKQCYTAGQVDPDLGNLGRVGWNNDMSTWLRLYNSTLFFSSSILYIYEVFEHVHMLWKGIFLHPYTVTLLAKLTQIWVIWGCWDEIMMCWHGWGSTTPLLSSHIHIVYIKSVWARSYAVEKHMCAPLLLEPSQMDTYVWTHYLKFLQNSLIQLLWIAYLLTSEYQYWFLYYIDS
jgi:hypothetical protein